MGIEIEALNNDRSYRMAANNINPSNTGEHSAPVAKELENILPKEIAQSDLQKIEVDLNRLIENMRLFDRTVKLHYNDEINRVIITVMKKDTNEVIKEFPSVEIQHLAMQLKKAIGILFDQTV